MSPTISVVKKLPREFAADYSAVPVLPSFNGMPVGEYRLEKHPHGFRGNVPILLDSIVLHRVPPKRDFNFLVRTVNGYCSSGRFLDQVAAENFMEASNNGKIGELFLAEDVPVPEEAELFWLGTTHAIESFRYIPVTYQQKNWWRFGLSPKTRWKMRFHPSNQPVGHNSFLVFESTDRRKIA